MKGVKKMPKVAALNTSFFIWNQVLPRAGRVPTEMG